MALPSISTPTFTTKIPSSGDEIQYRPFLVKEEKILLMALEGGDQKEISTAILKLLDECIITEIYTEKLSTFDVEYLFLKLRGKSVGEVIKVTVGHLEGDCKHKTEASISIEDIQVSGEIQDGKVMVTDSVGVKLRYPSLKDVMNVNGENPDTEAMFDLITDCVEYVYDAENIYNDFTHKEMKEWVESLSQEQFKKISNFFEDLPKLSHEIAWSCSECGKKDSMVLEGLQAFFT